MNPTRLCVPRRVLNGKSFTNISYFAGVGRPICALVFVFVILRIVWFRAQSKPAHYGGLVKWYHSRFIPLSFRFEF